MGFQLKYLIKEDIKEAGQLTCITVDENGGTNKRRLVTTGLVFKDIADDGSILTIKLLTTEKSRVLFY